MNDEDLLAAEIKWVNKDPIEISNLQANLIKVLIHTNSEGTSRLRELLATIHRINFFETDEFECLKTGLPDWFLRQSPPVFSDQEMTQWLKAWKSVDMEAKHKMEKDRGWPAEDWLYWMDPINRPVYLVASTNSSGRTDELIFASRDLFSINGATEWMLKCCGIEFK